MGLLDELKRAGLETIEKCNACRSTRNTRDIRFERLLCLSPPFAVRRCHDCGLRWLSPRPSPEGLRILYSNRYYFEPSDLPAYEVFANQRQAHFRERICDLITSWQVPAVLDFGAATGEFVAIAREEHLRAEGIEFSADARQQAWTRHGIHLFAPEQVAELPSSFGAIHMNHVLEHLPDPLGHLRWCHSILPSGGGIVIEVPKQFDNDPDRLRRLQHIGGRQDKFDAFSVHHNYFFAPRNLSRLVESAGFVTERLLTYNGPLPGQMSRKRKFIDYCLQIASRLHYGGDIIELWARKQ